MGDLTPEMAIAIQNPALAANMTVVFATPGVVRLSFFESISGQAALRASVAMGEDDFDAMVESVMRLRREQREGPPSPPRVVSMTDRAEIVPAANYRFGEEGED